MGKEDYSDASYWRLNQDDRFQGWIRKDLWLVTSMAMSHTCSYY